MRWVWAVGLVVGFCVLGAAAPRAAVMSLSASGRWWAFAPTTLESRAGEVFAFRLDLPALYSPAAGVAAHFAYSLDLTNRPLALTDMLLLPEDQGGMFDLALSDGITLSLFGPAIADQGALIAGAFGFVVAVNGGPVVGGGTVTIAAQRAPPAPPASIAAPADAALLFPAIAFLLFRRGRRVH